VDPSRWEEHKAGGEARGVSRLGKGRSKADWRGVRAKSGAVQGGCMGMRGKGGRGEEEEGRGRGKRTMGERE